MNFNKYKLVLIKKSFNTFATLTFVLLLSLHPHFCMEKTKNLLGEFKRKISLEILVFKMSRSLA